MNYELGAKKLFLGIFVVFLFSVALFIIHNSKFIVLASDCPATDYDCQIREIQKEIDALSPANENNKKELTGLRSQIDGINKKITALSRELKNVETQTLKREEDLAYAKEIFNQKASNQYKFIRLYDPLIPFFSSVHSDLFSIFFQSNLKFSIKYNPNS